VIPCLYAAMLIGISTAVAAVIGFWAGRMREQLALLEILRPET
jgi:zinc transporter ZupT